MSKLTYVVRDNLVVRLSDSKTYQPGEKIDLSEAEYELHAHQLETEAQYLARSAFESEASDSKRDLSTQPQPSKGSK